MFANGPAIWGGCVTRRKHRAGSWYFSQKAVTVQGGYGALFAVQVQILLSITSVAVQVLMEPRTYPRLQSWLGALAQCRGKKLIGAIKLSRYNGIKLRADERIRMQEPLQICLEGTICKNCDEPINYTVRVMCWHFLILIKVICH